MTLLEDLERLSLHAAPGSCVAEKVRLQEALERLEKCRLLLAYMIQEGLITIPALESLAESLVRCDSAEAVSESSVLATVWSDAMQRAATRAKERKTKR